VTNKKHLLENSITKIFYSPPWPAPERGRAGARAEYNICKIAGVYAGHKHSDEIRREMSESRPTPCMASCRRG